MILNHFKGDFDFKSFIMILFWSRFKINLTVMISILILNHLKYDFTQHCVRAPRGNDAMTVRGPYECLSIP